MTAAAKDRTAEFQTTCETFKSKSRPGRKLVNAAPTRGGGNAALTRKETQAPLLPAAAATSTARQDAAPVTSRTDFTRRAALISRNIQATAAKLERLTTLAKKKSLFDDRPVEIQELTHVIKQDIANLSGEIASLQQYQQATTPANSRNRQIETHGQNVLSSLKSKLASATTRFKDVLEIRTQAMKAQRDRKDHFSFVASQPSHSTTGSSLYNPTAATFNLQSEGSGDMLGAQHHQQQEQQILSQQQLMQMQPQNELAYAEERSAAFETIESTVQELASIFTQMGTLLAQQKEQIGRIDQDIDDIEANVAGGQQQLLRYMNNISSNRWLLMKIFAVLIVFIILWSVIA